MQKLHEKFGKRQLFRLEILHGIGKQRDIHAFADLELIAGKHPQANSHGHGQRKET
jgi:hypothetical protein